MANALSPSCIPALYKTAPMAHQLDALRKSKGKTGFMFSMEQGTGKTWVTINEAAQLWGEGKINGMLVFADNGVHTNWVEMELPLHMPDWVKWQARAWNSAALKAEAESIEEIMGGADGDSSVLRIFTVNWEALAHERSVDAIIRFCNSVTKLMMVGDESQAIMNPSAKRVKELEKIKAASVVRRTMTGTPIGNAPFDLFAQYRFLDPTILRTTSFYAFKTEYADMMPAHHPMMRKIAQGLPKGRPLPQIVAKDEITGQPAYKNLPKLARLIEPFTFRVLKADCLDLPPKVYTQTFFEIAPAQRAVYRKMEKEFRYLVGGGPDVAAVTKLVALGKLTQITSGFLMTKEEGTQQLVSLADNPKLRLLHERLEQSIEQLGNHVIVWCRYIEELTQIRAICEMSEWKHATYYGQTDKAARTEAIRAFQAGELNVIIVQINTGSTGITLHAAAHVIYYSNTFSYIDRSQSEDRAHRIGQTKSVLYEDLVAKGTRDMNVVEALRNKKDLATIVNGDARELLEEWTPPS